VISSDAIAGLAVSAALAMLLPVVVYFMLRKRLQLPLRNVFTGAAVFIVMVLVLEAAMHVYLLKLNPVTKAFFDANGYAFAFYAAMAAAIFEETGRYGAMRWLVKATPGSGSPVSYAIGHGGAEAVLIGVNIAVIAVLGYLISTGQAGELHLDNATQTTISDMFKGATLSSGLLSGIERAAAFVIQLGLSFLVWQAVSKRRIGYWFVALAAHFAVDFPAALMQKKLLPISVVELEVAVVTLALLILAAVWAFAPRAAGDQPAR
jgi:uncharacterized membrane protein YhfC